MEWSFGFVITSIGLGFSLAMDAFSVSLANGLNEPGMKKRKMCTIAGVFAIFQAAMPMLGWLCVHTIVNAFQAFERYIPWIALALLVFIGGNMLLEGIRGGEEEETPSVGFWGLIVQGVATSIDALSVGFTNSGYNWIMALVSASIIAVVTFVTCMIGLQIGKCCGTRLARKASVLGGVILIIIGIEIWLKGIL